MHKNIEGMMNQPKTKVNRKTVRSLSILAVLLFVVITATITLFMLEYNRRALLKNTQNTLHTVLNETIEGLKIWSKDKKEFMAFMKDNEEIVPLVEELLTLQPVDSLLMRAPAQGKLRAYFQNHRELFGHSEFSIITKDKNFVLGSFCDDELGEVHAISLARPAYLERALNGEAVFIPPFRMESHEAHFVRTPTMFLASPLVNKNNEIIACIARKVDIENDFSELVTAGQIGNSGETYAFDRTGTLITKSRFENELRVKKILSDTQSAIFNIQIAVPGNGKQNELTKMAQNAILGESGSNFKGYTDYRGEMVFGVWHWMDELGFGVTTEIDREEVMGPFYLLRRTVFITLFIIILIATGGLVFVLILSDKAFKVYKQAQFDLEEKVTQRTNALNKSQEVLRKALTKAEAATKAKSAFLANMSHEIRTPMNAVMGFAELLLQTPLNETQLRYSKTINNSATMLLVILNDILDVAKMEEGKLTLEKEPFAINSLVYDVVDMYTLQARKKGLTITAEFDPALGSWYKGDPTRLRQIISNLVSNAVKFTHKGTITIGVKKGAQRNYLRFNIKDTGIGIAKKNLKNIFKPFTQADDSTTRKYGGTGLGTSISRQLVELMEGEISVKSTVGEGSLFSFTVNLPEVEKPPISELKHNGPETVGAPTKVLRILLAEDVPENAELVEIHITNIGHTLVSTLNGVEVVEQYKEKPAEFDLILMDIHMPQMDGLEATRTIRAFEKEQGLEPVSIIALSASVLPEERHQCIEAGMNSFVSKPIKIPELFAEIAKYTDKPMEVIQSSEIDTTETLPSVEGIDTEAGIRNWMGKEPYIRNVKNFITKHNDDISLIQTCIREEKWQKAIELCHTLKGAAGNLSLTALSLEASLMEEEIKGENSDYATIADRLSAALHEARSFIEQVSAGPENETSSLEVPVDSEEVQSLLTILQKELFSDNPDQVEPLLEKLQPLVKDERVGKIKEAVEDFEFREAETILKSLLASLNIEAEGGDDA